MSPIADNLLLKQKQFNLGWNVCRSFEKRNRVNHYKKKLTGLVFKIYKVTKVD